MISQNIVTANVIAIKVILLSLEKLLSSIPPVNPATDNIMLFSPIRLPINKSRRSPNIIPIEKPVVFPKKSPINRVNIINKFGFIPAILYQLKKLVCKMYNIKNTIKNAVITNVLFIISPFTLNIIITAFSKFFNTYMSLYSLYFINVHIPIIATAIIIGII